MCWAKASANRTVNHEAIKRRAERLKAQQTEEYANDMPKDPNVYDSPEKAFENALGGDIFAQVFKDSNLS